MRRIQIQTRTSQLLIRPINKAQTTYFLNLPLDEYINNSKCTKFEFQIKDQSKHN
jgi:hypothetical protein